VYHYLLRGRKAACPELDSNDREERNMRRSILFFCLLLLVAVAAGCKADTTPPEIVYTSPSYGQSEIDLASTISIGFTEAMNKDKVEANFTISPHVSGKFTWNKNTLVYTPGELLQPATEYTVSFAQPVTDLAGNTMADFAIRFTTQAPQANAYSIQYYVWLPDSNGLLMSANIDDVFQIYQVSADGKALKKVDSSNNQQIDPTIASDGKTLAYIGGMPAQVTVYDLMTQKRVLIASPVQGDVPAWPMFSPDGRKLAYLNVLGYADAHSDLLQSVWVVDRTTGVLTESSPPGETDWLLGFSADSNKLYVLGTHEFYNQGRNFRYDLWELDLSTGEYLPLSSNGLIGNYHSSSMHPNKSKFVYASWEPRQLEESILSSPTDLFLVEMNPFKVSKLTSKGRNAYPAYSPDGTEIVFAADRDNTEQWEIYSLRGSVLKKLTDTGNKKLYPRYSPDGTLISFVQVEGEAHILYVMRADGSDLRRISR